jgi:hypothetical protein
LEEQEAGSYVHERSQGEGAAASPRAGEQMLGLKNIIQTLVQIQQVSVKLGTF